MTNIYNKFISFPNGTLINNWFEEDELKRKTGHTRRIQSQHLPKKSLNFDNPVKNTLPRDDTFKRVIGEKEPDKSFLTTYNQYGNFDNREAKYMHARLGDEKEKELFQKFSKTTVDFAKDVDNKSSNFREMTTTYKATHVPQPFEENLGRRHMFTPDNVPIPKEQPDKLFMAQHKMGKFPTILSNAEVNNYIDKNIPYYKDKEITYWSTNIDKGNTYRTFTLGINPFGKSNAFTQPIHNTRGCKQYYGNNKNISESKHIYLNDYDMEFYNKYKGEVEKTNITPDIAPNVQKRILDNCSKKGWVGLRQYKIFLGSLSKNKCSFINQADFKFYSNHCGVNYSDIDLEYIFKIFDKNKNDRIDYIEMLNSFRKVSDVRKEEIEKFIYQVSDRQRRFISVTFLEKIFNPNIHPEVFKFIKTARDIKEEYEKSWDILKEDDLITEDNFREFFYDISSCIQSDEDFMQCLLSCGYKIIN